MGFLPKRLPLNKTELQKFLGNGGFTSRRVGMQHYPGVHVLGGTTGRGRGRALTGIPPSLDFSPTLPLVLFGISSVSTPAADSSAATTSVDGSGSDNVASSPFPCSVDAAPVAVDLNGASSSDTVSCAAAAVAASVPAPASPAAAGGASGAGASYPAESLRRPFDARPLKPSFGFTILSPPGSSWFPYAGGIY